MPNHLNENIFLPRKIIHIDMDCFYAAIEIRDNLSLNNKPVAVGRSANQRGVLCTCVTMLHAAMEFIQPCQLL